jgi:APA family basic amino acid/polyamine antiporter
VGAIVQNSVVILKLGLLAALLAFAAAKLSGHSWHSEALVGAETSGWATVSAFAGSLVWISLSYAGFNAAVYIADEVDDAGKVVPRALLFGTSTVLVLYVLLNAVFVYAPPAADIAGVPDVAAVSAAALGGSGFEAFVRLTISAALLTSVFAMMMAAPRVYAKMAADGLMPDALRFKGETPQAAIVVQVLFASALVLMSTLRGLLSYLGLTLSLSAACAVACLFSSRVRNKRVLHRSHILPALYITCTLTAATLMTLSDPWQLMGTLVTFAAGGVAYAVIRRGRPVGFRDFEPNADTEIKET